MGRERGRLARLSREARERAMLSASLLAVPPAPRTWPERPLRYLPRPLALVLLAALALALAWSALGSTGETAAPPERDAEESASTGDFALYARIAQRVATGEGYYQAAFAEHRGNDYPLRPFVAVRLPTLAWANAWAGRGAMNLLVAALLIANLVAWHRALLWRASRPERIAAVVLAFLAGFAAFEQRAGLSHELVAGLLLSLALAICRPGLTGLALAALALALAVRELALPFALAWLALALIERRGRGAGALALLLGLFAAGLYVHYLEVDALLAPVDRASPGWGGMEGPRLFLDALVRFTPLSALPHWLAGPLALLPLVGWIGLGGRVGVLASVWFAGFVLVMALGARAENFYWVLMVLPAYGIGLAFVPRALKDLVGAARGGRQT